MMWLQRRGLLLLLTLLLVGALALPTGCNPGEDQLAVGSKEFTEQIILGQIAIALLEDHGYDVVDHTGLGGTEVVREALVTAEVDLYWEYTGTGLMAILGYDEPITDSQEAYQTVAEEDLEENGIVWLDYTEFDNTYTIMMREEDAEELGIESVSDLAELINSGEEPLGEWQFVSDHEYTIRPDGVEGLQETYGFEFAEVSPMDEGIVYGALRDGEVPVAMGFATDGRIAGYDLVNLEDDLQFHPVYNAAPTVRSEVLEANPEIEEILNQVIPYLDTETMAELNARVDIEEEEPEEVARDFLQENGLISGE